MHGELGNWPRSPRWLAHALPLETPPPPLLLAPSPPLYFCSYFCFHSLISVFRGCPRGK